MSEPLTLSQVQALMQAQVREIEAKHGSRIEELEAKHESRIEELEAKHGSRIEELERKNEDPKKEINELKKTNVEFAKYTDKSRAWMRRAKRAHNSIVYSINDKEIQNKIKDSAKDGFQYSRTTPLGESNQRLNAAINRLSSTAKGDNRNNVCHTFHNDDDANKRLVFTVVDGLSKENLLEPNQASDLYDKMNRIISDPTIKKLEVLESPPKAPPKRPAVASFPSSPAGKRGKKFVSSPRGIVHCS